MINLNTFYYKTNSPQELQNTIYLKVNICALKLETWKAKHTSSKTNPVSNYLLKKLHLGGKLLTKYDLYPLLVCFNTNVTFVTLWIIPNVIDMKGTWTNHGSLRQLQHQYKNVHNKFMQLNGWLSYVILPCVSAMKLFVHSILEMFLSIMFGDGGLIWHLRAPEKNFWSLRLLLMTIIGLLHQVCFITFFLTSRGCSRPINKYNLL